MKKIYSIVLTPAQEGGYVVYAPDFDINTQGDTLEEALFMARDAISLVGITKEDMGQKIPAPSGVIPTHLHDEAVAFVDVDFDEYRILHDDKKEKTTLSIRSSIKRKATRAKLNLSNTLEEAILAKVKSPYQN
ncbi:MAG: type II toxin-antitoxin system HicB family antitoxin [Chloroflexi bacterium]|nr:type II toxin-antitoxin system HicB family antitoxin [Chloroflexota bacterium]